MITANILPPSGSTVQQRLWHIAGSDNSGQTGFQYVFEVFVDNLLIARTKVVPEANGNGYFDASAFVRNKMSYAWFTCAQSSDLVDQSANLNGEFGRVYDIRVGEDFSGTTTYNMASGQVAAYNYTNPVLRGSAFNIADYHNRFMTNRRLVIDAKLTDRITIPHYRTNTAAGIEIKTYSYGNNLLQSVTVSPSTSHSLAQLNISPAVINGYATVNSTVKYYTVQPVGSTEAVTVNLVCNGYETIPLHFLNFFGAYDTALFDLVSIPKMNVDRKSFTQRDSSFGPSSVDYRTGLILNESKINYNQTANQTYTLTMNSVSDQDYIWLKELIYSAQIYALLNGFYHPVTITNSDYVVNSYRNNRLVVLQIDIEINQPIKSHYR